MLTVSPSHPAVDNDALPLGEVPLAPIGLTGRSEAQLASAMACPVLDEATDEEAATLRPLRTAFADSPLTFRLSALAAMMRRSQHQSPR